MEAGDGWRTTGICPEVMVRHWNRLPIETVDAPSLEMFKVRLNEALSNLIWWEVSLSYAGVLELDDL